MSRITLPGHLSIFLLSALVCISFTDLSADALDYPPEVAEALDAAGDHRIELEKVLEHYASADDSLKLQAAYFLVSNMEGHCYVTYMLCDFDALIAYLDSLEDECGELNFKKDKKIEDLNTISADFLINQIDYAPSLAGKTLGGEPLLRSVLPVRSALSGQQRTAGILAGNVLGEISRYRRRYDRSVRSGRGCGYH